MQNKYEAVDSIKEISLEELDQIIGAGKNGVFKTISHEYRMNSFQFYSLVVLNVMSLVILDVATKRGKPLFVFSCLTKTTSCASGSEKLLAMYQKSPPKVLY